MNKIIQELQQQAKKLLEEKTVQLIIGYGQGSDRFHTTPVFINTPEQVIHLTWSPFCVNNLAKYLTEYKNIPGKIAIVVKGCDSRAVNRLLQDNQIERDKIIILGIPCSGMLDPVKAALKIGYKTEIKKIEDQGNEFSLVTPQDNFTFSKNNSLITKCYSCINHNPVTFDVLLGPRLEENTGNKDRYADIEQMEKLSVEDKNIFWEKHFSRCLRCYACRNICPACTCQECIFTQAKPAWVERINNLSQNTAFHLIRAFHVAGRCVDCGECDRVCPVNIPLRHLNQKIMKDIQELYNAPVPGTDLTATAALGSFSNDDPEEFM